MRGELRRRPIEGAIDLARRERRLRVPRSRVVVVAGAGRRETAPAGTRRPQSRGFVALRSVRCGVIHVGPAVIGPRGSSVRVERKIGAGVASSELTSLAVCDLDQTGGRGTDSPVQSSLSMANPTDVRRERGERSQRAGPRSGPRRSRASRSCSRARRSRTSSRAPPAGEAVDDALAEIEAGAEHPSFEWRQNYSLLLGLERVLSEEAPKLLDGATLSEHQVDALSGTLAAITVASSRRRTARRGE